MKIYNVYALRWGEHDPDTTLFLGGYRNKDYATIVSESYKIWRGGKYECVITNENLRYVQFIPSNKIEYIIKELS